MGRKPDKRKVKAEYKRRLRRFVIFKLEERAFTEIRTEKHGQLKKLKTNNNKDLFRVFKLQYKIEPKDAYELYLKEKQKEKEEKERLRNEITGYVYVIGNVDHKVCKIGYSKNPERRIKDLQTGYPYTLSILRKFKSNMVIEKELHEKYDKYRLNGEWFRLEGELKKSLGL